MSDILDILTADEAQSSVRAQGSGNDVMIALYTTAVSRWIDGYCGPMVVRTITAERHDTAHDPSIRLAYWPISSITSVVEYAQDDTATTLTADTATVANAAGYLYNATDRMSRTIYRYAAGVPYQFPYGGHVAVTYVAGRYATTTAAVDPLVKLAASIIFQNLWRFSQGTGNQTFGASTEGLFPGFAIPNAAVSLLSDFALPVAVA